MTSTTREGFVLNRDASDRQRRWFAEHVSSRAQIGQRLAVDLTIEREFVVRADGIDSEARTVPLAFASELPYERWWGTEILDLTPESVRMDRMRAGTGALLVNHNIDDQVGVVASASIGADRVARAVVRFGKSVRASEIFQDVKDGIRKLVSVGYRVHEMVLESKTDVTETYRVTDWEPYEISIVAVPADPTVGIGRSHQRNQMMDDDQEVVTPPMSRSQLRGANRNNEAERERAANILALARMWNKPELAQEHIERGTTLSQFREVMLDSMPSNGYVRAAESPDIGLTARETREYSLVRAIRAHMPGADREMVAEAGFELEASRAVQKKLGRSPRGFFVPAEVMMGFGNRDLVVGTPSAGGNLVQTDVLAGSFIELLRNSSQVLAAGATLYPDLRGHVAIPRQTSGASVQWVAEGASPTESQLSVDQVAMTPKSIAGFSDFSRKLVLQSSLAVENLVRTDLVSGIGLGLDLAAINGSGTSNQPRGVLQTAGIGSEAGGANGAAPTWDNVVNLESSVAVANTPVTRMAYLTNSKVRGKLKRTQQFGGTNGAPVWGDERLNGYQAFVSNQVPSNLVKGTSGAVCSAIIFGNWADLMIGLWGGLDVLVDPYTGGTAGIIRIVVYQDADVALRYATSFAAMVDALTP